MSEVKKSGHSHHQRGTFFREDRLCAGCCRICGRFGKYLAFSLPGGEVRRRNVPAGLYPADRVIWICADHVGDSAGKNDA